jgi:predicted ArsR family transcriptional regulator
MEAEIFIKRKKELINQYSNLDQVSKQNQEALKKLLEILNEYSFENRLQMKGTLSHTIIDSLDLDATLGEKFMEFDDTIK